MDDKYKQDLYVAFSQMFRALGQAISSEQLETMRGAVFQVGTLVKKQAKREATELMRNIQGAVIKGFNLAYTDIEELNKRVTELEKAQKDKE